ncbi:phosphatidylinositol 4-kinase gamma 7-like isoform X2 [Abrus precatorius]|uniref:1-phosphatidylinositol 4-kinase n=1 Tax=Abrus precatorius TaxID=3816 RepID=A0A8B8KQR5_ABRPR|nr:phosphatidylinositol 4-kinase gamma 7-like isoform X2 [Abrus precatorius]
MSHKLDSPVQTQMAVTLFRSPLGREYHENKSMEGRQPTGRRRVFVQTETGCVMSMELDRSDNAHTVKRRLQVALNVPTEESSLTFGDVVLKNDLSLKRSVRVGETGFREVAAYLLDYDHFANVPPTALVKITHSIFNVNDGVNRKNTQRKKLVSKIASLQEFIPHDFEASDHGTSSFPVTAVHRIGILDVRILNTDRHAGNLLVRKLGAFGQVDLIPIDHGLCLPEALEDPYFEWIHWPQASIPFSEDELSFIENLDPARDWEMLRTELPMIREACLRVLVLCTIFLKEAAAYGLCLAEIGEMMTREFRSGEEGPSELEVVCLEVRKMLTERDEPSPRTDLRDDEFQFDIDCDEVGSDCFQKMTIDDYLTRAPFQLALGSGYSRSPLAKLDETIEEGEEESVGEYPQDFDTFSSQETIRAVSKLSVSMKNTKLCETSLKHQKYSGGKTDNGYFGNTSSGHRSANEQLPASTSFVKLADMTEDEWTTFLEKFQELLYPAFAKRKFITLGQRQRQRLGTSCQF